MPIRELIEQTYLPPSGSGDLSLEALLGNTNIRFFSYGRHALLEGLRVIGVMPGDRILVPEFICRDLLSAINSLGAVVNYYSVDRLLRLSESQDALPDAKAIIAVNYFGFPQDLRLFRDYCKRTDAVLIEDNAHGLFSRDKNDRFLGTRGDIGIFSLRKTIPMPDGAALLLNNLDRGYKLDPQVEFSSAAEPLSFRTKQLLRDIARIFGTGMLRVVTSLTRRMRKLKSGHEIMSSPPDAEHVLPGDRSPCRRLLSLLAAVDVDRESRRRRELYSALDELLKQVNCQPVFKDLPDNAVPYGYPFYALDEGIGAIKNFLNRYGLECFRWPELPDAVGPSAPEHYKTIWLVSFLW